MSPLAASHRRIVATTIEAKRRDCGDASHRHEFAQRMVWY